MKYQFLFFVGAIIFSCQPKGETALDQTNKRVKSVLESTHDPVGNADTFEYRLDVSEDSFISELLFSVNGVLLKESKFDSNGNLKCKAAFTYDGKGNTLQCDVYASNGSLSSTLKSKFDSVNQMIERNLIGENDKLISKQTAKPNSDGYRVITTYKLVKGSLAKTLESIFDKRNFNTQNNYFINEAKEIYIYDLNGNWISGDYSLLSAGSIQKIESAFEKNTIGNNSYLTDETLKSIDQHEYDADGNRIETNQYFRLANKQIITRYTYHKNRMEAVTLTGNLMISSKKVERYDAKGNVIESFKYGIGGRLEKHQRHLYEYDQVGNWTKHKTITNNKPVSVVVRQIEYF